ncbi:hypothetical protein SY83_14850 [Paenibacillus swuensis]|uniref:DUF3907 domain-containing protein n=1 Tax=Paenibacillus swuensis TaxID=1178515 RepID=A0A172TJV5_9BACL|nr:YpuI family protein [Paenibacillus swuensis]ANE47335.1 hypothetical protein SY83_14850 [Paenibacillus swuensis]
MANNDVKNLCETTRAKLKEASSILETFLNRHALPQLTAEEPNSELFYSGCLSDLRQLLVFSEVNYEKLGVLLRRPNFPVEPSEKALYEVYHQCVNAYFYPKNESYAEDGRYAYTGQDAIRFRTAPHSEVKNTVLSLSSIFEELREDLAYYESDYITQRRIQGEKV